MKNILRIVLLTFVGFSIAIVIYPFIHELGHFTACKIVGAEVSKFSLFPAFVECNVLGLNRREILIIGISGNLLPTIVMILYTLIIKPKNIYIIYTKVHSAFTCWFSWLLSLFNIIAIQLGYGDLNIIKDEDIAKIVIKYPDITILCLLLCVLITIVCQFFMLNKKTLIAAKEQLEVLD